MISKLIEFFMGDQIVTARGRIRSAATASVKCCDFCRANVPVSNKVCRNCLTRFSSGLAGERWVNQGIEHQVNQMAKIDRIKYGAHHKLCGIVRSGAQTIQKLSLSSRFKTA